MHLGLVFILASAGWLSHLALAVPKIPTAPLSADPRFQSKAPTKDDAHEGHFYAAGGQISRNYWDGRYGEDVCTEDC